MKKIDRFINCYPLSKTLRFSLIPIGKTEDNFNAKMMLEEDEKRAESYEKVKEYIDRYHKSYIESVLSALTLSDLDSYAELYYKSGKSDADKDKLNKAEETLRKQISKALTETEGYTAMFSADIIKKILPEFLTDKEEKAVVAEFDSFYTYFIGFAENRKNMYSKEAKASAIPYRCINDNLPKFLDNAKSFNLIKAMITQDSLNKLNEDFIGLTGTTVECIFEHKYFSSVLSQSGIDKYNEVIGGYTCSDGTKVQGLNEHINLYNQQVAKEDKSKHLPLLKPLFKQILSDKDSVSFIPEKFSSDDELLQTVNTFYKCSTADTESAEITIEKIRALFSEFDSYDTNAIYVSNGIAVTEISNAVFGSWNTISDGWNAEYSIAHPIKKNQNLEKYEDERRKSYKKIESFSIAELQRLGNIAKSDSSDRTIIKHLSSAVSTAVSDIRNKYIAAEKLLTEKYTAEKKLFSNDDAIALVKNFLDSIKTLERLIKPLNGSGKEEDKDSFFYGEFSPAISALASIDRLYDKVRNYLTQKPYSKDKIKLNFENPVFLSGWTTTKERNNSSIILKDEKYFYLGIMDKDSKSAFVNYPKPQGEDDILQKMCYYQIADPSKDVHNLMVIDGNTVRKTGRIDKKDNQNHILEELKETYLPKDINRIRKTRSFSVLSENFSRDNLNTFIDFYKERIFQYYAEVEFHFKPSCEYKDFSEFTNDAKSQSYHVTFSSISRKHIETLIEKGQLYLFRIYNKDLSEHSKGIPNLHTLYFKMLFDERNIKNVVYQLNGGAEMFYRKASISDAEKVVHPKNQPIKNKNPENQKSESLFSYDIIKDRRFTKRQFSLHIPITLNFKAQGISGINERVRRSLKHSDDNCVIGIDRGERNLIYICVVNSKGEIVEQTSLNEIIGDNGYKVDYRDLLDRKEKERESARQNWTSVENIKELKEGYLSQVVHKICELVIKYDAVIAMEDLNSGFKNSRIKVEKQVYQKFEKMLTDKLNYLVDKKLDPEMNGGILNAYQLTNKDYNRKGVQDGFIFYIPAWLTSKIDPSTGFTDLLKPKYTTVPAAKDYFSRFKSIIYNREADMFEFSFDYSDFPKGSQDYLNSWTICSNGERILTFRNAEKNSAWDNKTVVLTAEFKRLFKEYGIDICSDIKAAILEREEKDFFLRLTNILKLTLQMRNSITGNVDIDYLISPVRNSTGQFYDSRYSDGTLPENADANGAYNIARKALWSIDVLKNTADEDLSKAKLSITNKDWLKYAQEAK